jgi:hypothetical protein
MRCPKCHNIYQDPMLKYCLQDGTLLEPQLASDQDAPTLLMNIDSSDLDNRRPYKTKNFEGRCKMVMQAILMMAARQPITEVGIRQLAPRFMTGEQAIKAVEALVEEKPVYKYTTAHPDGRRISIYWWDRETLGEE